MPRYSPQLSAIPEYPFARVGRLSREVEERDGISVVNARIGIPDEEAPPTLKRLMAEYVLADKSTFGYPVDVHPERGAPELIEAIIQHYKDRHGVTLAPENIAVTSWSKEALHHLARLYGEGNGVVPEPVYPAYEAAIALSGHTVRRVGTSESSNWLPDFKFVDDDAFFYFCDPNNPTGVVADKAYHESLLTQMNSADVGGIFDRAYKDYVFDDATDPLSIAQVPGLMENSYEVVSFSKHHNFVGIGLGWIVSSPENIDRWLYFAGQYGQGVPWYKQMAGYAALTNADVKAETAEYMAQLKERRDILAAGLNELGLECELPKATPYIWAKVPEGHDDEDFVLNTLLGKAHVAFMPGSYFGASGKGHFRATIFLSKEDCLESVNRIAKVKDW